MSPESQKERKRQQKIQRDSYRRRFCNVDRIDVSLDSEQDSEMCEISSSIDKMCSEELEKLFVEGDEHGVGSRDLEF